MRDERACSNLWTPGHDVVGKVMTKDLCGGFHSDSAKVVECRKEGATYLGSLSDCS